jgi:2-oxoglutarate dehydrogenase E2 component (dihydrolipoamide succinyltransferase)
MPTQILMPKLGETVVEGTVSRWLAAEGERVQKMAPLLEISTDKVDTELPSPAAGLLLQILVPAGATVPAGTVLGVIGEAGEVDRETGRQVGKGVGEQKDGGEGESGQIVTSNQVGAASPDRPVTMSPGHSTALGFVSPVVARLAAEHGIDLAQIQGTGLKGRIRKQDLLAYLSARPAPSLPASPAPPLPASPLPELRPLSRMRRLIAEHMVASKRTSPHVTTVFDCDLTAVVRHRYAHKDAFARDGANLTFTPYFVAAIVAALKQHPLARSSWSEEGIVVHRGIHIGVAVAIPDGLIVPVIKNADSYNLLGLARAVEDLAQRGRSGKLAPDDIQGGTFTLTNHGAGGSLLATPIINQPQAGILGVGKIHKAPVVISRGHPLLPDADDVIAIRPVAYLSFTFDHRILDGATADAFVSAVKAGLEGWGGG